MSEQQSKNAPLDIATKQLANVSQRDDAAFVFDLLRQRFVDDWQRLLHIGCGNGLATLAYAAMGYTTLGIDTASEDIRSARHRAKSHRPAKRCEFRTMYPINIASENDTFDIVVATNAISPQLTQRVLGEIQRVLRPGGLVVLEQPVLVPPMDRDAPRSIFASESEEPDPLGESSLEAVLRFFEQPQIRRFTLSDKVSLMKSSKQQQQAFHVADHQLLCRNPKLFAIQKSAVITAYKPAGQQQQQRLAA